MPNNKFKKLLKFNITLFTSLDTVNALLDVLEEITIKVGTI